MELALPLLPLIAPDVAPPIAYRAGDEPPRFVRAERRRTSSPPPCARQGARRVRDGRTGLIAPGARSSTRSSRSSLDPETAFDELGSPIQALTPRAAKGLEFDRVVLVEPAAIAAGGDRGPTRALRRAHSRDEDARGRARGGVAGRARDGLSTS